MLFSESEGTGIQLSESEGTGLSFSESEGTGLSFSEKEGTGMQSTGRRKSNRHVRSWLLSGLMLLCISPITFAKDVYLYHSGDEVYQGVIVTTNGDTQLLEGIIEKNRFSGFIVATIQGQNETQIKSVDDGTGDKSVDDGTGGRSVDDGTGGGRSVDDGTGQLIVIDLSCNGQAKHTAQVQVGDVTESEQMDQIHINGQLESCGQSAG